MSTFLERNGRDLTIASVVAPLVSYGLHRMIPAPNVRFIAVASTLNIYAAIFIRDWAQAMVDKLAGKLIQEPTDIAQYKTIYEKAKDSVAHRLQGSFEITLPTLLPIFWRFMGQRMGIPVPDYIPMVGYVCLAMHATSVVNLSIGILRTYRSYQPGKT